LTKKIVYQFKPFIKIIKENYQNKHESRKNFHQIYLQNSAMVIVQDKNNKVLFLNEYRRGLKKKSLGFPGGNIEKKEKPIQAVKRELLEESGLVAEKWKLLFKYSRHGTYNCGKDYVFLAQNIKKIKSDKKIEKIERRWFSKSQIIKNLNKDKFETSGVLSVVLYYLFKKI
jgi:ADP-ribose pyrophosphatase|tara:strand:+ start:11651 stop:12163 length:513 start_codon:yes stop_codon:yes gene_type:complete